MLSGKVLKIFLQFHEIFVERHSLSDSKSIDYTRKRLVSVFVINEDGSFSTSVLQQHAVENLSEAYHFL